MAASAHDIRLNFLDQMEDALDNAIERYRTDVDTDIEELRAMKQQVARARRALLADREHTAKRPDTAA